MTDADLPRIYVTIPGVEDLTVVVIMLRGSGAEITDQHREFVITGPLTAEQASAAWDIISHTDNQGPVRVRVEPEGDPRAALDLLCPGGWEPGTFNWPDADGGECDEWWMEQQRLQDERRRRPAAPTQPAPAVPTPVIPTPTPRADGKCCGQGGTWAPEEGSDLVIGCILCPSSVTYWRTARSS